MIEEITAKLARGEDLGRGDVGAAMAGMLSGDLPDPESAEFLSRLAGKGETDDELLWMLDGMRGFAVGVEPASRETLIDMCGTGGDGLGTFNVSTAASFVAAAAGARVAKHGNRSSSGASGSADVFEYLGYDLGQGPEEVAGVLERHGIAFMFAQRFHPAMRHVAAARRLLPGRTAFNLLGPLSNPAGVKNQVVGVYSAGMLERIPRILERNGSRNVMAVMSGDGMDEFSTSAANRVCVVRDGRASAFTVTPEEVGLRRSALADLQVGSREDAMSAFVGAVGGTARRAMVETAALNAAGGLVVAGAADGLGDGVEMALEAINGGGASRLLEEFVSDTGDAERLAGAA